MIRGGRAECRHIRPVIMSFSFLPFFGVYATNHVEGDDIAERDFTGLVPFHEDAVDDLWAAASWKTEHERLLRRRVERVDAACLVSSCRIGKRTQGNTY
jgi:hypothetical protein